MMVPMGNCITKDSNEKYEWYCENHGAATDGERDVGVHELRKPDGHSNRFRTS